MPGSWISAISASTIPFASNSSASSALDATCTDACSSASSAANEAVASVSLSTNTMRAPATGLRALHVPAGAGSPVATAGSQTDTAVPRPGPSECASMQTPAPPRGSTSTMRIRALGNSGLTLGGRVIKLLVRPKESGWAYGKGKILGPLIWVGLFFGRKLSKWSFNVPPRPLPGAIWPQFPLPAP